MNAAAASSVIRRKSVLMRKRNSAIKPPVRNDAMRSSVIVYNSNNKRVIYKQEEYTLPFQEIVKKFYLLRSIQILVAVLIIMNFVTYAIQSQTLPESGSATDDMFVAFEYFYVYVFFIELLLNMYGHYWWPFWKSGWNWFDLIIVLVSFLAIYLPNLPAISVLRLFRAFRVVRLFKRVKEMRKMIEGVLTSLPSLSYAFGSLGLITGIWAIIGVDLFGHMVHKGQKGYYFGNFFKSCLSLLQITTFDSWSSGIARDIIYKEGTGAALYFVTFVFVASIIMMNVLVALLLDNYLSASPENELPEELSACDVTPRQAMEELVSYIVNNGVNLGQLSQYLREQTFPDFLAKYHPADKTVANNLLDVSSAHRPASINKDYLEQQPIVSVLTSLLGIEKQLKLVLQKHTPAGTALFFQEKQHVEAVYSLPYQKEIKSFYLRHSIQMLVAVIILMNFITAAIQTEILPKKNSQADRIFVALEYFYLYAFLIELLINMYGHYLWEFWWSGWNWFDFLIVLVSFLALYFPNLPAISVLRLFRAFRVVRLFKRVKEMKKIIEGIMRSVPALSYAFVAMGLIMGIWAIMGVDFFGKMRHRGRVGYYFGTFFRALLSLGQITTFDSWSDGIARDIIYEKGYSAALYFITFVFICSIILMNVLVALLLENYLSPPPADHWDETLTPEEAMEQLSTHIRENNIDLSRFAKYLNQKAFSEYLLNYHNLPSNIIPDSRSRSAHANVSQQAGQTPETYSGIVELSPTGLLQKQYSPHSVILADCISDTESSSSSLEKRVSVESVREFVSCESIRINLGEINDRETKQL